MQLNKYLLELLFWYQVKVHNETWVHLCVMQCVLDRLVSHTNHHLTASHSKYTRQVCPSMMKGYSYCVSGWCKRSHSQPNQIGQLWCYFLKIWDVNCFSQCRTVQHNTVITCSNRNNRIDHIKSTPMPYICLLH